MPIRTSHFKVDNGDMTLVEFESGRRLLIDIKIRQAADGPKDDTPDVAAQLRDRIEVDAQGRAYVDAFLLTHPDADHISGLRTHFHLGSPESWDPDDDKILINEMWSSPIVFRRAGEDTLCDDAKAWTAEARRRVALYRSQGYLLDGDRIKILGEDVDGKTDGLEAILVEGGASFSTICGETDASFEALLIAPLLADDAEEDEILSKNNSSVILGLALTAQGQAAARYLFGGDAEVAIWERVRDRYTDDQLRYDVLIAPHHCSWHSLSWDSWSKLGEAANVSPKARSALGQAHPGATVIASSVAIKDDDNDPPCIRAKREYRAILRGVAGPFVCLADGADAEPYELQISAYGPKPSRRRAAAAAAAFGAGTGIGSEALGHG